jgi:hypothetical protein
LEQAAVACCTTLFLTNSHVDRESLISAKGTRVKGTCEWITHDASYRAWLSSNSDGSNNDNTRLLWISGRPGKGKTMLSVFLTEELEKYTAGWEDAQLAFFFCSAWDKKRNTAVAVLRGLPCSCTCRLYRVPPAELQSRRLTPQLQHAITFQP